MTFGLVIRLPRCDFLCKPNYELNWCVSRAKKGKNETISKITMQLLKINYKTTLIVNFIIDITCFFLI